MENFFIFVLVLCHLIAIFVRVSFCQIPQDSYQNEGNADTQALTWYSIGEAKLNEAKEAYQKSSNQLDRMFEGLKVSKNYVAQLFESGPLSMSEFFDNLNGTYKGAFGQISLAYERAPRAFESALEAFDSALAKDQTYVDAHVRKSEIYAWLRRIDDAVAALEKAEQLGLEKLRHIDLLSDELTQIVFHIAGLATSQLYLLPENSSAGSQAQGAERAQGTATTIAGIKNTVGDIKSIETPILDLVKTRRSVLVQRIQNETSDAKLAELRTLEAMYGFGQAEQNGFLLPEFYKQIGWQSEANFIYKSEFEAAQSWLESNPELYSQATVKIVQLGQEIEAMNTIPLSFEIDEAIPARVQLLKLDDYLIQSEELLFSFLPDWSRVDFIGNITQKRRWLHEGSYSVLINIPEITIQQKDQLPFSAQFKYGFGNIIPLLKGAYLTLTLIGQDSTLSSFKLSPEEYVYDETNHALLNAKTHQLYRLEAQARCQIRLVSEILLRAAPDRNYVVGIQRTSEPTINRDRIFAIAGVIGMLASFFFVRY